MSHFAAHDLPPKVTNSPETLAAAAESQPIFVPEESGSDWLISLLIFGVSLLYLRCYYRYTVVNADEGIILQGAQRVLQGQVPYRDFFSFFTPGSYYWIAFFFKIFGSSILVGRTVLIVEGGLLPVLIYLLARRVCSRWSAMLVAYFATLICLPHRFIVLHNWDSTLWAALALYCGVRFLEHPSPRWALAVGSFSALTCLFEQSKGVGVMFGLGMGFLILVLIYRRTSGWNRRSFITLIAGIAWPFLLTLIFFSLKHGLPQLLADWFWPLHHYSEVNKAPFGFLTMSPSERDKFLAGDWVSRLLTVVITAPMFIVPVLPFIAIGVLPYWAAKGWRGDSSQSRTGYYVLTSATVLGLLMGALATGRADFTHLVYIAPFFFLTMAWIIDGQAFRSQILGPVKPLLISFLVLSCTMFGLALLWQPLRAHDSLQTRRGTLKSLHSDEVIRYVQAHVPAGEKILVYPYLPLYYYLTATFSPGRYEYLMPGFHTPQQFEDVINELDSNRTRVILFEITFREKIIDGFPSATPEMLGARDPVAEYIALHYRACAGLTSQGFWHFMFMVRKDLTCPASQPEQASGAPRPAN